MKKILLFSTILLTVIVLTACAAPALTPDTALVKPTVVEPGATLPAMTPDPTSTPEAMDTPVATSTPTAEPTSTATAEPTITPAATDTPAPTATPTVAPTPAPQVRAAGNNVNVRRGPGTAFPVVGDLRAGKSLPVLARGPKGWLQVEMKGKPAWIYSGVVEVVGPVDGLTEAENIPTPPPTPTPQATAAAPTNPNLPPKQDVVHLTQDTRFPVRANRFIGWGYEIVDASDRWDVVLNRDVFGHVLHEFYGDEFYKEHPHGMRVTFVDCVSKEYPGYGTSTCGGTEAPIPLFGDKKDLISEFGDGVGSVTIVGCAAPAVNYYDPEECFVGLGPVDAGYLNDIAIVGTIVGGKFLAGYVGENAPDFRNPPFTPNLGNAIRDDQLQQWRWQNPFLQVMPQQP